MPTRVLITGVTGFAGSHLAERLIAQGAEVHGFAFEEPPYANLAAVRERVTVHRGDISSLADLQGMRSVDLVNGYECSGNSGGAVQGLSSNGRFTVNPVSGSTTSSWRVINAIGLTDRKLKPRMSKSPPIKNR